MEIKVELLKPFKDMIGSSEITMEIESDATATNLLEALARKYPKFKEGITEEDGTITDYITMFINDKPMSALQGMETVLNDGDKVMIFMPVSGG